MRERITDDMQLHPGKLLAEMLPTVREKPGETIAVGFMMTIAHKQQHGIGRQGRVLIGDVHARGNGVGCGCAAEASDGLGISLGDDCIVEAGLYVTAGTVVIDPSGNPVKAKFLSGQSGLLYRRNSLTGAVEVISRTGSWGGLNADLHKN